MHYDAFKRLVGVDEHNDGSTYSTAYAYDTSDNLISITDAESNVRNFTFDGLGRRLTAQDLHASADGTYGVWSYGYDLSGNLTTKTDSNGQDVNYTYDALNRVLTENYTGQGGIEVEYSYDSCQNGVLKMCIATSSAAVSTYTYNPLGQSKVETRAISGTAYTTTYTHDRLGNIIDIIYPDNSEVQYSYNSAGLLESVAQKESGGSFEDLVSDFDYAPMEKVAYKAFANGVQSTYTYNPNELYRLQNILTLATSTGGGGGMAFSGRDFFGNLAKAIKKLPLAILGDLDLTALNVESDGATTTEVQVIESFEIISEASTSTIELVGATSSSTQISATSTSATSTIMDSLVDADTDESISEQAMSTDLEFVDELPSDGTDVLSASTSTSTVATSDVALMLVSTSTITATSSKSIDDGQVSEAELLDAPPDIAKKQDKSDIRSLLAGKDNKTRANIKGKEIAKLKKVDRIKRDKYDIEIVSTKAIEGGIEAYVRAWDENGKQIGFGRDGSVDMERFQIFNPPILVPDQKGPIVQELDVPDRLSASSTKHVTRSLREDPQEALLQVIEQNLAIVKNVHGPENIVSGKKGKTVSTFYPYSGTGTDPVDGTLIRSASNESWSTISSGSGNSVSNSSWYNDVVSFYGNGGSGYTALYRSLFGFDTSSLGIGAPKTIDSATLSIRGIGKGGAGLSSATVLIDRNVPADETALTSSDYNRTNWDHSEQASNRITYSSWNTSDYNNFTLNATGTMNISTSSNSWFGTRSVGDYDESAPVAALSTYIQGYFADKDGTSFDPKLVVEHTSTNHTPLAPTSLETEDQTDPTNVTDSTPELSAIFNDTDTADVATNYQIQVATTSDFASLIWDSNQSTLASSTPQGTRIAGVSYAGTGLASSTTYYWRIKFWDYYEEEGAWSTATSTFSLASQAAPNAPSSLEVNSQVNPTGLTDVAPGFTAVYEDSDYNPVAISYQVQVASESGFAATSTIWDSEKTTLASSTPAGMRIAEVEYGGDPLISSTTYYWRIRFWDDSDLVGAWSTTTATFSLANPSGTILQHITFEYDNVGNIVGITDTSDTAALKTLVFDYDDLYRLTVASTTVAANNPFRQTYSYDAIGNITNKSDIGSYTYSGTGYANPHAVTEIFNGATTTYAYDNNGNLTSAGSDVYLWDYENRLVESGDGSASSTYAYDHTMQRVSKEVASSTTKYPIKYFNTDGTTDVKHVFAGGDLIATLTTVGATTTTQYIHTDQLGSTNVVSDSNGDSVEVSDYYPFGSERISTGAFDEQRKFTGYEYDEQSNLLYAGARYYDQDIGKWMSQDPVFQNLGVDRRTAQALRDPQSQNAYSYVKNNPLRLVDDNGEWFKEVLTGQQSFSDFQVEVGQATEQLTSDSKVWNYAVSNPGKAGAVTGLVGGAAFLTGAPAVAAYSSSVVTVSAVGRVLVTNRLIEGSIYSYLTADALSNLPDKIQRASEVRQGNLNSYTNFVGGFALDYGPGAFGETADAVGNVVQLAQSLVSNLSNFVKQQKGSSDNKE